MTYEWLSNTHILALTQSKAYGNNKLIGGVKNAYKNFTVNGNAIPLQWQWSNILKDNSVYIRGTVPDDGYTTDGYLTKIRQGGYWIDQVYTWDNGLVKQKTFGQLTSTYQYYDTEAPFTRQIKSVTDENGFKSTFEYDAFFRLKEAKSYFADNTLRSTTTQTYTFGNGSATNPNKVNGTTTFVGIADPLSTTQYFDGLGRPIEVVKESYTPKVAPHENTAWHQKNYITYDALGRQDISYHPFESATKDLETTVPSGTPYVYAQYEASPLSRPLRQYAEDGKYVQMDYGANTSNEVRYFTLVANTEGGYNVNPSGFYALNTLYKTTITNENGTTSPNGNINKTDVFKDKLGRVVLTRKYLDNTEEGKVDTYNIYDDYGNLVMVIPPDAIDAGSNVKTDLVFTYKYNNKNLLCEKKIPGADVQKFYYNSRDLLVLTQDGNMRAENPQKHIATEYDALGRLKITGYWYTATPETVVDNVWYATWNNLLTQNYYDATKNRLTNQLTYVLNKAGVPEKWLSSYFSYNDKGEMIYSGKDNLEGANIHYYEYNTAGKSTRHETYHWGRNGGQYSHNYQSTYDHALRNKTNTLYFWGASVATPLPTMQLSAFTYNYKDQVTEKNIGRNEWVWGAKALQSIDYQYNQRGWLTDINQQPLSYHNQIVVSGGGGMAYTYPDPNPTFSIQNGEGSVDLFSESIRYATPDVNFSNLATPQYNGNISQAVWQIAGREQQAYTYKYDNLDRLLEGEYTDIHDMEGYTPFSEQYSTDNKFGEKLTYDLRGNILSLQRNGMIAAGMSGGSYISGTFGQIDNLAYTYNSKNQVTAITDAANATKGFKGSSSSYTYDANGNLKSDVAKGITNIVYNYLNLPQTIEFTNSRRIEFIYDATGMKLRKTTYENGVVKESREYMDGFEYVNDKIERIHHAEGVITQRAKRADEGTEFVGAGGLVWQYEYTLKDHLGNTRVTFADIDGNRTIDPNTEINQINHYYPYGLNMEGNWNGAAGSNKYGYNGKEWNDDFGLSMNDYGARLYDPAIGRWNGIDQLAEKYNSYSPYHYVYDNPMKFVDPDGKRIEVGKWWQFAFRRTINRMINEIEHSNSVASLFIGTLKASDKVLHISKADINGNSYGDRKANEGGGSFTRTKADGGKEHFKGFIKGLEIERTRSSDGTVNKGTGGGTDAVMYTDISRDIEHKNNGTPTSTLAHELLHAFEFFLGLTNPNWLPEFGLNDNNKGMKNNEFNAVLFENLYRKAIGMELRSEYDVFKVGPLYYQNALKNLSPPSTQTVITRVPLPALAPL